MQLQTTRFGTVEIEEERILAFPHGLLGFPGCSRFALLQSDESGLFFWLQSVEDPELAFVVTEPAAWVPDYRALIRKDQMEELGLETFEDAQTMVIVNRYGDRLTANLQGPLVVNTTTRNGMQLVLADRRWTTRHEILQVGKPMEAAIPA